MSIATLKKKSQVQYRNLSVGQPHFSINGTRRSQGYVGQTSLSRSLPRTLMNGTVPRGHGGCCGYYPVKPIIQSGIKTVENPNIIKNSVISTKGMLEEKSKCITNINIPGITIKLPTSNAKNNIVKPDNNKHNNYQGGYVTRIRKLAIQNYNSCTATNQVKYQSKCANNKICNLTKPVSDFIPISQGEYLLQLNNKCVDVDIVYDKSGVNTKVNKTPFACGL